MNDSLCLREGVDFDCALLSDLLVGASSSATARDREELCGAGLALLLLRLRLLEGVASLLEARVVDFFKVERRGGIFLKMYCSEREEKNVSRRLSAGNENGFWFRQKKY